MKILDDGPDGADAHEFAVELATGDEPDGAQVRALWASAPDKGDYGIPHALVRCQAGKADTADVRAAPERFNEAPDNGWRWTVDALMAYLLHGLCGIALLDCRHPPTGDDEDAASPPGGRKR